jgi:hypothetical protein
MMYVAPLVAFPFIGPFVKTTASVGDESLRLLAAALAVVAFETASSDNLHFTREARRWRLMFTFTLEAGRTGRRS